MSKRSSISDGSMREYMRMKEEQSIENKHGNARCFVYKETDNKARSMFAKDDAITTQNMEPEVMSFPVVEDISKNIETEKPRKNLWKSHRAKFWMISAVVHMKESAKRRVQNSKDFPMASSDDVSTFSNDHNDNDNDDDPWSYLRKCRYLRGQKEDEELSIEEIFK